MGNKKGCAVGRQYTAQDYVMAYYAGYVPYVELDDPNNAGTLVHHSDPEKQLMRKEIFCQLSNEAQEVIYLVLDGPAELIDGLRTNNARGFTRHARKLLRFIARAMGREPKQAQIILRELQLYAKELDDL